MQLKQRTLVHSSVQPNCQPRPFFSRIRPQAERILKTLVHSERSEMNINTFVDMPSMIAGKIMAAINENRKINEHKKAATEYLASRKIKEAAKEWNAIIALTKDGERTTMAAEAAEKFEKAADNWLLNDRSSSAGESYLAAASFAVKANDLRNAIALYEVAMLSYTKIGLFEKIPGIALDLFNVLFKNGQKNPDAAFIRAMKIIKIERAQLLNEGNFDWIAESFKAEKILIWETDHVRADKLAEMDGPHGHFCELLDNRKWGNIRRVNQLFKLAESDELKKIGSEIEPLLRKGRFREALRLLQNAAPIAAVEQPSLNLLLKTATNECLKMERQKIEVVLLA